MHAQLPLILVALGAAATTSAHQLLQLRQTSDGGDDDYDYDYDYDYDGEDYDDYSYDDATPTVSPECESSVEALVTSMPYPPEDLMEVDIGTPSDVEDLCVAFSAVPSSLSSAFSSYNSELYSYYSAHSAEYVEIVSKCPGAVGGRDTDAFTSILDAVISAYSGFYNGACDATATSAAASSSGAASAAASSTAGPSATTTLVTTTAGESGSAAATGDADAAASTTTSSTPTQNAGPRETGMMAAAALAMGVLGAAVAL
ncbi:hypothetical protein F4778DRAFT_784158 [Xylariomycetidae sp. FL2044]|nr:hypothetical protein F4778DRAFT_784158 [Xylariomycetidae sp. FL2044]